MSADGISLEDAAPEMAGDLLAVYAPYVTETAVSFECDVPTTADFAERIRRVLSGGYPWIVARRNGEVVGYAYAGEFNNRRAYFRSAELSIYIRKNCHRLGIGRRLYAALAERLAARGVRNLYACIAVPNAADDPFLTLDSVRFHERLGFRLAGRFTDCAEKFGRLYSMVWMERFLAAPDARQGVVQK